MLFDDPRFWLPEGKSMRVDALQHMLYGYTFPRSAPQIDPYFICSQRSDYDGCYNAFRAHRLYHYELETVDMDFRSVEYSSLGWLCEFCALEYQKKGGGREQESSDDGDILEFVHRGMSLAQYFMTGDEEKKYGMRYPPAPVFACQGSEWDGVWRSASELHYYADPVPRWLCRERIAEVWQKGTEDALGPRLDVWMVYRDSLGTPYKGDASG